MKENIFLDGKPLKGEFPLRSLFYGEGLFETFRWKNAPPAFLDRHLERMRKGAEFLGIPYPGKAHLEKTLREAVAASETGDAYVKLCLLSKGSSTFYQEPEKSSTLIIVRRYQPPKETVRVHVASFHRNSSSPTHKIKSLNYLENVIARREARDAGFDETIFLNERGELTEGSSTNLFWIKGNTLFTPSVECGLLPGITRALLLEVASDLGFKIQEGKFGLEALLSSEGGFLTNSLIGISAISNIEVPIQSNPELGSKLKNALFKKLRWL